MGAGDWTSFFELLPPELRHALATQFGLPPEDDFDSAIGALADGPPPDLVELRIVALALANPDSELVENEFEAEGQDLPDLPGRESQTVWLFLYRRRRYDEMAQLLEYERHFQKDNSWNGYEIDAGFDTAAIEKGNAALKSDLADVLRSRVKATPEIDVSTFQHASSRSGESALHVTVAFGRGRETVRTIEGGKRGRQSFRRERVISVVIDPKAHSIDIVGKEESKPRRKRILLVFLKHMGIAGATYEDLPARWILVDRLARKIRLDVEPTDLPSKVRLVAVTLSRGSLGVVHFDARYADAEDTWKAWARWAGTEGHTFGAAVVIRATLEFTFPPPEGASGPDKVRLLRMSAPHSLVVRHWAPEQVSAATSLLARWGLLSWTRPDARSTA